MESLMWYVVGMLFFASVLGFVELSRHYPLNWLSWSGLITGAGLILFCLAWSVSSFEEGVPQSGAMGLIFFGGGGLVVLALTWRYLILPAKGADE